MTFTARKYYLGNGPTGAMLRLAVVASVVALLSGCSGNSFLARQFDDFTAHYNKFYNANRTFQEQERKLKTGDEKIDTDRFLSTFELPEQRGRSTEFEKVITKCADLLRNHPRSKWVDDALMLIGKSYFYQSNFVGAEQKFNEIINAGGELREEAEFWLARTLVAGQSSAAAEEIIGAALANEDLDKEWRSRFLLLRGDLRTEVGLWETAIEDIEEGVEHVDDGDTAARAYFLLGQLYEQVERYEDAVWAYQRARDKKPLYELSYAAMVGEIRVMGLHVDPEKALDELESAMRENKHFQNRHHLQYLHARILAAAGDPVAARESFFEQLYPSDPTRKTSLRGEVHYRLAELYRDYLDDFYAAGIHFDTASTVLRSAPAQNEQFAPDAITDARDLAATFRDYRETLDQVARMDSLLYLASLDQAAFDSAVAAVRVHLAEEAARIQAELERRQTESRFRQAASEAESRAPGTQRQATDLAGSGTFGFLNHKNLQRVQEGFLNFKEVWGDRPLVPGWRREEAVALAQRQAQAQRGDTGGVGEEAGAVEEVRFLPPVDISEVPRDSAAKAEMLDERAQARYRLANVLFLSLGLPDSAAKWYRKVIDENTDDPVAHRALYAMAEVHEALGDEAAATRTLRQVIERYPKSEFAAKARSRLGVHVETMTAATDTLEMTTERYEEAYGIWKRGAHDEAIEAMVRLAADFPEHEVAAKALLASARIFLEKAHQDGDDVYGVIPVPDSVFTEEEISAAIAAVAPLPSAELPADSTGEGGESDGPVSTPYDSTGANPAADTTATPGSDLTVMPGADTTATPGSDLTASDTIRVAAASAAPDAVADTTGARLEPDTLIADARPDETRKPEVAPKRGAGAMRDDVAVVHDGLRPSRRDGLVARVDSNLAGGPPADERVDEVPAAKRQVGRLGASPDTGAVAAKAVGAAVVDTTQAVTAKIDSSVVADSAGMAQEPPLAQSEARKRKVPEIEWMEPVYFVEDLIPVPMTLHSLYSSVVKRFGDTPYGKRAADLRNGLEAVRMALAVAEMNAEEEDDQVKQPAQPVEDGDVGVENDENFELESETSDSTVSEPDSTSGSSSRPGLPVVSRGDP